MSGKDVFRWFSRTFGFNSSTNIAAWVTAGGLAYLWFYIPQRQEEEKRKVGAI
jgi:hypothetical protein